MKIIWSDIAWLEYVEWESRDKKTLKKINELIKDISRNGATEGIGHPEKLKYNDCYSRRIDKANRLVYDIDEEGNLLIASCCGHYEN